MIRRAFTLLELILALGLTVIVVAAITTAIHQYLFQLTRQQAEIERKQIARGVVRMVTEDLRAAIQFKPQDYSGLEDLIESQSLSGIGGLATGVDGENIDGEALEDEILDAVADGDGAGGEGGDGGTGGAGGAGGTGGLAAGDEQMMEEEDEEAVEEEEEEEVLGRPALIGSQNHVRVDTSRLPRIDEYNPLVANRQVDVSLPSDVKTVTWFHSGAAPLVVDPILPDFGKKGGLYRRQIDRAVEAYRGEEYIDPRPDNWSELVSPEVSKVSFRYWNGDEWRTSWDSAEEGGFPFAIEVKIVIDPSRAADGRSRSSDQAEKETYRTVVHLPVADPAVPEEEEMVEEEVEQEDAR